MSNGPLRVLQIAPLVTPYGAFGGPVRVALNQTRELQQHGVEVTLIAGAHGHDQLPLEVDGVPATLFRSLLIPRTGFFGVVTPGLLRFVRRSARSFDVVHVHVTRDLTSMPAALLARTLGSRVVLQTHGTIVPSRRPVQRIVDAVATRRLARSADTVFCLNDEEQRRIRDVVRHDPSVSTTILPNGVPVAAPPPPLREGRSPEVLFLARLHRRKNPVLFAEVAVELTRDLPEVVFTLVGPDEGEAAAVESVIAAAGTDRVRWEGPLAPERTQRRFERASVYVLPSDDEPFGMTILEAMCARLPVVLTDSCQLAGFVRRHDAGLVVPREAGALSAAIRQLLEDPVRAARMGANGRAAVAATYSMATVRDILLSSYRKTVEVDGASRSR
jgi:glycosyltransferase involved in cell wall biosynthesis